MLSKNQIKQIAALHQKKYRQQASQFIVDGEKMVHEVLQQAHFEVLSIFGLESWVTQFKADFSTFSEKMTIVSEVELSKISTLTTPNKVLAVLKMPDSMPNFEELEQSFSIFLDGVQDPSNLGAILRVADWFGIRQVFCSPETVDVFNPKAIQASMGAFLRVQVFEMTLDEILSKKRDLPVLGAVLNGQNLFENNMPSPKNGLLVMGNEGKGITPKNMEKLTHRLTIPRHPTSQTESLNVSVAMGILTAVLMNR